MLKKNRAKHVYGHKEQNSESIPIDNQAISICKYNISNGIYPINKPGYIYHTKRHELNHEFFTNLFIHM